LLTSASGPATGLRVDLAFVAATGQGVPDTMGAAGPIQYLAVLNSIVRSFDKNTGAADGVLNLSLSAFFSASGAVSTFDPKVRFDRLSGRWFVVALSDNLRQAIPQKRLRHYRRQPAGWKLRSGRVRVEHGRRRVRPCKARKGGRPLTGGSTGWAHNQAW
jgi:hypothetical protein